MKKILFLILSILILSTIVNAKVDHFYEIKLNYDYGNISYDYILVKPISAENKLENIPGGFVAEVLSYDIKVLNLTFFDIPLEIIYDQVDRETGEIISGGLISLNKSETTIKVPYYDNAEEINIYDKDINKRLTIDLSSYAKNVTVKPEIRIIEEELEEEKSIPLKKELEKKPINYTLFLIIGLILVVILLFIIVFFKKKR